MIHLVHAGNRRLYQDHLLSMHRHRHDHFIKERGWSLAERDGGEYDDYDDDQAMYLLGFTAEGDVACGARVRSTGETSLIADVFPHLIADTEGPMKAWDIYEVTRYFCAKGFRGERGFLLRSKMHVAVIELMLDRGGRKLLGFTDIEFVPYFRRFSGMRIRPVGLPQAYAEGVALAYEHGIAEADLAHAREVLGLPTRQLFDAPAWLPSRADPLALAQTTEVLINADAEVRQNVVDAVREQSSRVNEARDVRGLMAELARRAA